MMIAGVCRHTVFTYRDRVTAGGVKALLHRDSDVARKPTVRGPLAEEFLEKLGRGEFWQARDAQAWIQKRTRRQLSESGVHKLIRRLGGKSGSRARAM